MHACISTGISRSRSNNKLMTNVGVYIYIYILVRVVVIKICNSRSLLSGEALEEHLRFAIDTQVLDGLRVSGRSVCAPRKLAQGSRAHMTESLLHLV